MTLSDVNVVLNGRIVLDQISVRLSEPRIGVIGANGSGKSTFARLLNGLQLPSRGSVAIDGLDTRKDGRRVRQRVGFVFQNPDNQIVYPTVGEDLAFGLKNTGCGPAEVRERIDTALSAFGLDGFSDRLVHQLSGGEKQLVALLGVSVMGPDWIVLDEPTTGLDLRNRHRFMKALAAMPQTVVMVTHDLAALQDFDRIVWLENGTVRGDGPPDAVIDGYVESCQ